MPARARQLPEKFQVAFSFAGEQRDLVRAIAEAVEKELGSPNVFFDEWFEHYIAGEDADLRLQEIYGDRSALVVVCISDRYGGKPWTLAEHAAIRARLMKARAVGEEHNDLGILPIRVGEGEVRGVLFSSIVPDVRTRTAIESAQLIIERLRLIVPSSEKRAPAASGRSGHSPPLYKPMADQAAQRSVGTWIFGGLLLALLLAVLAIRWLSPTAPVAAGGGSREDGGKGSATVGTGIATTGSQTIEGPVSITGSGSAHPKKASVESNSAAAGTGIANTGEQVIEGPVTIGVAPSRDTQ